MRGELGVVNRQHTDCGPVFSEICLPGPVLVREFGSSWSSETGPWRNIS